MKTIMGLRTAFSSLTIVFCIIAFSGNVAAQTLPSATQLLARASVKSYPRTIDVAALKSGIDWDGRWVIAQRKLSYQYADILPPEPLIGTTAGALQSIIQTEEDKTLLAAAVWLRTGSPAAAAEAKRRALNLASWSPAGMTGFPSINDQAARSVTVALVLAYDWLYGQWTPAEQTLLLSAIRPRLLAILSNVPYGLNNGLVLDAWPYGSHRQMTMAATTVICTVLGGRGDSLYDQCVIDIVPRYLARPVPWGVNDGGYSQGTNYAHWDLQWGHFRFWAMLKQVVSVDLWQTAWAKGYINYMAYFLPPGTAKGMFGDNAETNWSGVWATQGKTYAGYLPSPLANWYARNLSGEEKPQLTLLLAPQQNMSLISTVLPTGTANGVLIPSIGWAAMHSDLGNPLRTSVYFKSSPYGSYNHSHADQNSFILHAGGQVLAIDSGYYDSHGSAHWQNWYKQTKAHNAITYDGGLGQTVTAISGDTTGMDAKGAITQFSTTANYDLVTGDALPAYGGALTTAVRSMVYLRPNTLVVFDSLTSVTPRTWEWNAHALSKMAVISSNNIKITQGGVLLCVRQVAGPSVAFSQTNLFSTPPNGTYSNQWHGTFSSLEKSTTALFVTVLEVGCTNAPLTVVGTGNSRTVTMLGYNLNFSGNAVTVATR